MSRTQAEGSTDHPEGKELHAYQPLNANTNIAVDKAHHGQLGEHFAPSRSSVSPPSPQPTYQLILSAQVSKVAVHEQYVLLLIEHPLSGSLPSRHLGYSPPAAFIESEV